MSRFEFPQSYLEPYATRLEAATLRVKIWHWFTPQAVEEDGNRLVFDANELASRFGNQSLGDKLRSDAGAELALLKDLQGLHYKSTIGLLAIGGDFQPVRLETFNTDGTTGMPTIQEALIDTRVTSSGNGQIKFR